MTLKILELARNDLIDGYQFYEKQHSSLGNYFLTSLYNDIDSLKYTAGVHRLVHGQFRRALSKRFPWAIYYTVSNQTIYIHAITDSRRNPEWIKEHLKKA